MVTVLGSHLSITASLATSSTNFTYNALQSISVEQPPLCKGQLERTGSHAVVLDRFHCIYVSVHHAVDNHAGLVMCDIGIVYGSTCLKRGPSGCGG